MFWRILPFACLCYFMAQLDRANISFAALRMKQDLQFSDAVYGLGAGIFYIGYLLLEIPGAIIAQRWSARLWIVRIMVTWGVLAAATAFVRTPLEFYVIRFMLGLAEAGFFPAMMIVLRRWFTPQDRAKAIAIFMGSLTAAAIFGAPVSGWMLDIDWHGWSGWRWMFILQGLPSAFIGLLALKFLPDRPSQARWLSPQEAAAIEAHTSADTCANHSWRDTFSALAEKTTIVLCVTYFCVQITVTGFNIWMPITLRNLGGFNDLQTTFWAIVPPVVGLSAKLIAGWSSDRLGERYWHTVGLLAWGALGMIACAVFAASGMRVPAIVALFVGAAGFLGAPPCFWAMVSQRFSALGLAVAIGAVNMIGSLGSFTGPTLFGFLAEHFGHASWSLAALGLAQIAAIACLLPLRKTAAPERLS